MKRDNINCFRSLLKNWKQHLTFNNNVTPLGQIKCGAPQGLILRQLAFLIYVNDLCNPSNIMDPILFADDTNHFYPTTY